jgi:protein-L-isoaspartate(D-aspartate) O-methyltransferase
MLGTHHDAWTFGGVDPGSSAAVVLETARALAALCKSGWQPRRSIQIAFWDAEEYGLIGSTEHAEEFADQLRRDAVAYINTDFYLAGPLKAGGTPALRALVEQEAAAVAHPSGEGNLLRLWPSRELEPLGSGADFVPFQTFLGLPALSLEFAPHSTYGAYHSNYDTAAYMNTHGDPGWRYGRALAELLGRVVLRLASEEEPPLRSADTAARLSGWVRDLASRHPQVKRLEARLTAFSAAAQNAGGNRAVRAEKAFVVDTPDRRWFRHTLYGWNIYALYAGQTLPALHRALEARDTASAEAELARLETALDAATAAVADRWERIRQEMVRATIEARGVRDPRVLQAMRATLRHEFVPPEFEEHAYQDHPLPIGLNQTISQPYIVALMTELLEPKKDDRVLEIGTGSGYQAAVLSGLVKQVYTIELLPELATRARQTLRRLGYRNIEVRAGDGYLGWPEQAPFDKIIVTAAPETVPEELVKQLKPGGRLVVPVGTRGSQDLLLLTKNAAGRVTERRIIPVAFVPMVKGKK